MACLILVVVNRWEKAQLWRNTTTNAGHWLEVKLEQPAPNRDAIGAWLEVKLGDKVMRSEITVGGGHASGQNGWWHVGLSGLAQAELRVIWPDGTTGKWQKLDTNNFYVVKRDEAARIWFPKSG
jgi:enediyne biosynthesis protein E4